MIYDIEKYRPSEGERFIFDTNVWLYIYSPAVHYDWRIKEVFGRFLRRCEKGKSKIYTTAMILSEFYNTSMKINYKSKNCEMYKRDFRDKQTLGGDIHDVLQQCILPKVSKLDDEFASIDYTDFSGEYDFNDYYLVQLCKKHNLKIVTNDSDFKKFADEVDVIMLNSNYVGNISTVKMDLLK